MSVKSEGLNTLGNRISKLLKISGITQRELASMAGVTEVSMSRYINNKRIPKGTIIYNIAKALHTTSDYLLNTELTDNEQSSGNYSGGWIYCGDGKNLPEEKTNPITRDFYEYQVTFKNEDVVDIRHYKFGEGHWWNGPENMDKYVIAWRQNIEPFNP